MICPLLAAAFILIFQAVPNGTVYTLHRQLGISAMTLGLTQVCCVCCALCLLIILHDMLSWPRNS